MAIVSKPASIAKGSSVQFTLNKTELAALPAISDAFFQDMSNWKIVSVEYKNAEGQKKQLVFKASEANPMDEFSATDKARSDFEVQSITIFDVDGGSYKIMRSDITVADFDIAFESAAGGGAQAGLQMQNFDANVIADYGTLIDVRLSWAWPVEANSGDHRVHLYRSKDGGAPVLLTTTMYPATFYNDEERTKSSTYDYHAVHYNNDTGETGPATAPVRIVNGVKQ